MPYFIIAQFDRDCTVRQVPEAEIKSVLAEYDEPFLGKYEGEDPATWGEQPLLIKGEVVPFGKIKGAKA